MQCPVCNKPTRDADRECEACGELLQPWRTIEFYGGTLRQRGLALAAQRDHLGAMLSFLEAAMANPLDGLSLVDAARALVYLDRLDDAERLLAGVRSADGAAAAAALKQAIEARRQPAALPPPEDDEPLLAIIVEDEPPAAAPVP